MTAPATARRWSALPHWQRSCTAAALAMGAFVATGLELLLDAADQPTDSPALPDNDIQRTLEGAST